MSDTGKGVIVIVLVLLHVVLEVPFCLYIFEWGRRRGK